MTPDDWLERVEAALEAGEEPEEVDVLTFYLRSLAHPAPAPREDRLLSLEDASKLLGVDPSWIRRRAKKLPFVRRVSPRKLVVLEGELRRWIAARKP